MISKSLKMKFARVGASAVALAAVLCAPAATFAYTFTVTAPSLNTGSYVTMGNFVQDLPQYGFDLITNNLPMFLFFVFLAIGLGLYGWLRSKISHRR